MRKIALALSPSGRPIQRPPPARGASIPAPVEGWDAVSPIAAMKPTRAIRLENWFPQPGWIELRRGFIRHFRIGTGEPVETLMSYQGVASTQLFAVSDDSIYDISASGSGSSASLTGLANARLQHINFATTGGNFLYWVNGADPPQYWDGSSWTVPAITGIDETQAIGINAHKNRLWFVLDGTSDAAYLPIDSVAGAATVFPLGGLFTLGGYLMAMGTWSLDAGAGPEDYAVFFSSRGQAAIYRGINPASDFSLVGVFNLGAPIGRRCLLRVGADLAVISIDGVLPLSKAMVFERAAVVTASLTQRIQRVMNDSARSYFDNFGWQLISYPRGNMAILNVPVAENDNQEQYVMNTLTGAWCRFTGQNANCWEIYNDRAFFGGNDGNIYEADRSGTDYGGVLTADVIPAFNYFNSRGHQKRWPMCRPLLTTDGQVAPGIAFNVDFRDDAPISIPSSTASAPVLWDDAIWDQDVWSGATKVTAYWTSVDGIGYCASPRTVVEVRHPNEGTAGIWGSPSVGLWGINRWGEVDGNEVTLQLNGWDVVMEGGSFI